MTEKQFEQQAAEESVSAIVRYMPYMESDDKRRALRTLRYWKRKAKNAGAVW